MEFGLRVRSNRPELVGRAVKLIDEKLFGYIDLFVMPGTEASPFAVGVPCVIHAPHDKFGVNIPDAGKKEFNLQKIRESLAWADKLGAKYVTVHAGFGPAQPAIELLDEINDSRILIENMPKVGMGGEEMAGYLPEQVSELIGNRDMGLCLDVEHAAKAAVSLKEDYKGFISRFLELRPRQFHISDGKLATGMDEHLQIGEGDYDFAFIMDCARKSGAEYATIEVFKKDPASLDDDVKGASILKRL
jgi:deoxyribonuclease-4